jgi:hypothetical protein
MEDSKRVAVFPLTTLIRAWALVIMLSASCRRTSPQGPGGAWSMGADEATGGRAFRSVRRWVRGLVPRFFHLCALLFASNVCALCSMHALVELMTRQPVFTVLFSVFAIRY